MKLSQNDRILRRKLYIALALAGVVLYSVYCFVVLPAYFYTLNDVAFPDAVPVALEYLGKILEVFSISAFCAITVYGIYRLKAKNFIWGYVIFYALPFYKYFCNLVADWVSKGSVGLTTLGTDLINSCTYAIIELLPFILVFFIVRYMINNYRTGNDIMAKAGRGKDPLQYEGLFDFSNCFMSSAFVCAMMVLVTKLCGMLYSDMTYILAGGLPTELSTVVLMLLNYSASVVFAALCYFAMVFGISLVGKWLDN